VNDKIYPMFKAPHRSLKFWFIIGLIIALLLVYVVVKYTWLVTLPESVWMVADVIVLLALGVAAYVSYHRNIILMEEVKRLEGESEGVVSQLEKVKEHQKSILQMSRTLVDANDEGEVVEAVLDLSLEILGVEGVSFVPLDDRAQPLAAMSSGEFPYPVAEAWAEYLASPAVRQKCASCQNLEELTNSCPLIEAIFQDAEGVYCISLQRGAAQYGMLNLYLPPGGVIDPEKQVFLRALVDEATLAMGNIRLRDRAMSTLHHLQKAREKRDLEGILNELLCNVQETLEADFVLVSVENDEDARRQKILTAGDVPNKVWPFIEGIIHSVINSSEPVMLGDVGGDSVSSPGVRALLAVPLAAQNQPNMGVFLAANNHHKPFTQRQLTTLQTIAGQAALMVNNLNLMAQLEYQTVIEERTRLAREIHDGLAQTLGFLKLKTAQASNYFEQSETVLLQDALATCHQVLADAYQDVRQSIDGLRISSFEGGLTGWLQQTIDEFQGYNDTDITLCEPDGDIELSPEFHAQLIRIVQEALSNIRKHARAQHVEVNCRSLNGDLILEIRDDGVGFMPSDIPTLSQHGLRGMRERAELIGADFQVISQTNKGTSIIVRLPLIEVGVRRL
jgi:two-component system nitrate/nitrite sensor histidine kinase NarX